MKNFKVDNSTGTNQNGPGANRPLRYLTATSVIGDNVTNQEGKKMGEIHDIMIDLDTGKIEYLIIELGGFLGIGEKYFAHPFSYFEVDEKQESFILNKDIDSLKEAPGFDKDHWPMTNSHEFDRNTSWGNFMGSNTGYTP